MLIPAYPKLKMGAAASRGISVLAARIGAAIALKISAHVGCAPLSLLVRPATGEL
jgi:hypothetical protein